MGEHKGMFIELIYDNYGVFLCHDEDLGYCDWITHMIPASTNKPVYLPQWTPPWQLQGDVCKCLNFRLHQGIICLSNSQYTFQVVILHRKSWEI